MINIILYKHSKDFYQLDYSQLNDSKKVLFVTPSPFHADTLRSKLTTNQANFDHDVITMSKYLKDELTELVDTDILQNFKGKAELVLYLSTTWKAISEKLTIGLFRKAYNILTDLRSFSLSTQVLETALEDYDQETINAVLSFHKVMQLQKIVDEHEANFLLSERLRKGDLPPSYQTKRTLVFWGFDFLSAVQVDLLKALGIRSEVIVPVVKEVYEKSQSTDWIKWLSENETNIIELDDFEFSIKASIKEFPSNYLSRTLALELKEEQNCDIYLATKTVDMTNLQEVNLTNHQFKVPTNLFTDSVVRFFESLQQHLEDNNLEVLSKDLDHWVDDIVRKEIPLQDFRYLKVLSLFKKNLLEWSELSNYNDHFTIFDLHIFKDVLLLNLPRVSLIPNTTKGQGKIAGLKELAAFDSDRRNILCITSQYGPIKSSGNQYTEKVEAYLTSIGPIRRSELEFEMLKHRMRELLVLENTKVFIEQGLIEFDIGWNSILGENEKQISQSNLGENISIKNEFVTEGKTALKSISATRIQSYRDCPRKYYLNYVARLNPSIQVPGILDILKMGELEHAVIENYLKNYSQFSEVDFIKVIQNSIKDLLEKYQLKISQDAINTYMVEIRSLCAPIIADLIEMNKVFGLNLSFEHSITIDRNPKITGSIDLFAHNESMQIILDFKRSGGSIPSQKGLMEFKKIQLWFYLQRLKELCILDLNKEIVFGYINLSRPEDSLILCTQEISKDKLKGLELSIFKKTMTMKESLEEMIENYLEQEIDIINQINNDEHFYPNPIEAKVCNFCAISNICARGEL